MSTPSQQSFQITAVMGAQFSVVRGKQKPDRSCHRKRGWGYLFADSLFFLQHPFFTSLRSSPLHAHLDRRASFSGSCLGSYSLQAAVAVWRQAVNDFNSIFVSKPNNRINLAAASEGCQQGRLEGAVCWSSRDLHAPLVRISAILKPFSVMIGPVHLN